MNTKRLIISVVAAFALTFLFEWVWHGILLMDMYAATAELWRPQEQIAEFFQWALASQLAFAIFFTLIFTRMYAGRGPGEGLRLGLYMGLFMAAMQFGSYPYLPIPLSLAGAWVAGSVLLGVLIGLVLSFTYKKEGESPPRALS